MRRTTLTLDDDVVAMLDKEVRACGDSFRKTVNHYLRQGLTAKKPRKKPFHVKPRSMGLPAGLSYNNVHELLEILEGPDHR